VKLRAAELAVVESANGRVVVRVLVTDRVQPGAVFVPIHWTDQLASAGRVDALVGAALDPVSGQPELKHTPVRVSRYAPAWYAFATSLHKPALSAIDYWALAPTRTGWRAELAGLAACADATALVQALLPEGAAGADNIAYHDRASGQQRFAAFAGDQFVAALFLALEPVAVARVALCDQIGQAFAGTVDRYRLLAGRPGSGVRDPGPTVCACFEVGRNTILDAITQQRCASVDAVGAATRAGTNCGSCRPEIRGLLDATPAAQAG
jgi:assimilatory nitrate reductase catalytic subunit